MGSVNENQERVPIQVDIAAAWIIAFCIVAAFWLGLWGLVK